MSNLKTVGKKITIYDYADFQSVLVPGDKSKIQMKLI